MSVAGKLQIRPGQVGAVLRKPDDVPLDVEPSGAVDDGRGRALRDHRGRSRQPDAEAALARRDALASVAYPKGGRLGTDLNRDRLAPLLGERGVRAVRQVSIDDTWSALRFRPAG